MDEKKRAATLRPAQLRHLLRVTAATSRHPERDALVLLLGMTCAMRVNADAHPLMRRMHKPDPKLGPDQQDKRSVVAIEPADVGLWLAGTAEEAAKLIRLSPVDVFDAGPATAI